MSGRVRLTEAEKGQVHVVIAQYRTNQVRFSKVFETIEKIIHAYVAAERDRAAENDAPLTERERADLAERLLAVLHGSTNAAFLRTESATPWRNALAQAAEAEHFFATRIIPPEVSEPGEEP